MRRRFRDGSTRYFSGTRTPTGTEPKRSSKSAYGSRAKRRRADRMGRRRRTRVCGISGWVDAGGSIRQRKKKPSLEKKKGKDVRGVAVLPLVGSRQSSWLRF